ncbi:MAG: CoA transferase [Dehalococcoidia bacterium]|nr:CoA transferase [Dehalococcoidia bacterium]
MAGEGHSPFEGLRVIELPGARTLLTGKLLADLGADVVKVEPPGGDPVRQRAPFAGGQSLVWTALNLGKRSIGADLETADGTRLVRELAARADVLLHGMTSAEAESAGFSEAELRAANPGLIITAVTAFGADGPLSGWQAESLQAFAAGGYLYMTGDEHGTPIQPTAPLQMELHAGLHAFAAVVLALRRRRLSGAGAFIDQSMRDTGPWMLTNSYQHWDLQKVNLRRLGQTRDMGTKRRLRMVYRTADGYAVWMFTTGHLGARSLAALVAWMEEHGMAPPWLKSIDWEATDLLNSEEGLAQRLEAQFGPFYATRTGSEILSWAVANGMMLAPIRTVADVANDEQLAARGAWRMLEQPGLGHIIVPGSPVRMEGVRWETRGTAPAYGSTRIEDIEWEERPAGIAFTRRGSLPLEGVRVLDFGTTLAGPIAARHMADFGAEVIKIESEAHPDSLRVGTPYAAEGGIDRSAYFAAYNAGKRSFALDLHHPGAKDIVRRLVERADVLLENFAPGVMARLGLTPDQLLEWNPRLIIASHSLQGQTGPLSRHRGYGQIASGMTGWYDLTGEEGGEPLGPYSAYTDFLSWPLLLSAILIALETRETTGFVTRIDHAQVESSLHFLAPLLLDQQLNASQPTRRGNRSADFAPNNAYRCRGDDCWIAITARTDDEWRTLVSVLGLDDDVRFSSAAGRKANEQQLDTMIASRTHTMEADDLAAALQEAGVPAAPVAKVEDLFADMQLVHRKLFRALRHRYLGVHHVLTASFRIDGMEAGPFVAAPLLGEHTFEVARDTLGLDEDTIGTLAAEGVLR